MTEAPEGIPGELKDLHRLTMLQIAISFVLCALSRHQTPRVIFMACALRWCAAGRSALSKPVERYAHMLLLTSKVRLLPCTLPIHVHSLFRASFTFYPSLPPHALPTSTNTEPLPRFSRGMIESTYVIKKHLNPL